MFEQYYADLSAQLINLVDEELKRKNDEDGECVLYINISNDDKPSAMFNCGADAILVDIDVLYSNEVTIIYILENYEGNPIDYCSVSRDARDPKKAVKIVMDSDKAKELTDKIYYFVSEFRKRSE